MDTNNHNREHDRDQDQDREQLKKSQDRGMNLHGKASEEDELVGKKGAVQPNQKKDEALPNSKSAKDLQDDDHRMDRRTNSGEVDGDKERNNNEKNPDLNRDIESRWLDIESDFRKRYPEVTDEDVRYRTGEFDNMTDRLAKRTNRNVGAITKEIKYWNH